ncbi:hypothetical protein OH76DRAFT_521101 [Lentinus brumalis]|uniref:Uncharacterized protein n=1 Tax=Lentinus brumalis TaxID=2498619 RepID=A0A371CM83_9APHY|nr:hypothetical protein OH76DRAFT_219931 [Polyporus brumalis]RDX49622.1 hypothetical protein OH76DRAFT_521101 [Polyporus brumalis]
MICEARAEPSGRGLNAQLIHAMQVSLWLSSYTAPRRSQRATGLTFSLRLVCLIAHIVLGSLHMSPLNLPSFAVSQVTSHSPEAAAQAGPSPGLGLSRPEGPA